MGELTKIDTLNVLKAIYKELKEIKKSIIRNDKITELEARISVLESRISTLEYKPIFPQTPYQPPIMFQDGEFPRTSPLFPQVMGNSNTENISELSKEIDSNMPKIINKPHIAKEFKK